MFTIDNTGYDRNTPIISLQSKKAMNYTGGSLKIKGDVCGCQALGLQLGERPAVGASASV